MVMNCFSISEFSDEGRVWHSASVFSHTWTDHLIHRCHDVQETSRLAPSGWIKSWLLHLLCRPHKLSDFITQPSSPVELNIINISYSEFFFYWCFLEDFQKFFFRVSMEFSRERYDVCIIDLHIILVILNCVAT